MEKSTKKLITIKELLKISGVKRKKLASYIKNDLLPFRGDKKLNRFFEKDKVIKRLKEIKRLENQIRIPDEIKKYLDQEPEYFFSGVQLKNKPFTIDEEKDGEIIRKIDSESKKGKKLIKEGRVKKFKGPGKIIILDK